MISLCLPSKATIVSILNRPSVTDRGRSVNLSPWRITFVVSGLLFVVVVVVVGGELELEVEVESRLAIDDGGDECLSWLLLL